jgi:hypothetical protein
VPAARARGQTDRPARISCMHGAPCARLRPAGALPQFFDPPTRARFGPVLASRWRREPSLRPGTPAAQAIRRPRGWSCGASSRDADGARTRDRRPRCTRASRCSHRRSDPAAPPGGARPALPPQDRARARSAPGPRARPRSARTGRTATFGRAPPGWAKREPRSPRRVRSGATHTSASRRRNNESCAGPMPLRSGWCGGRDRARRSARDR